MSVESKYKPVSYTGTGGTSVFPFGWVCYEKTWIHVSADGLELTQGTDYTVALESTSGGSITLSAPLAAGKVLIIWMDVPITQENRYPNTGQLNTVTIEKALDKQTLISQQLQDGIERSVKVPVGSQEKPEDVVRNIYVARDAAAASADAATASADAASVQATAAKNSADTAEQTVQTATAQAVADATAQATAAHNSALDAAQSAAEAAAASGGLAGRVDAVEAKNILQDTRLTNVETKNTQQDTRLTDAETALAGKANADLGNVTGNAISKYLHVRDEKPQGASGGSTTSGAWNTRDLNTIKVNRISASLASNRVTLPAGTYYIKAAAPCFAGMHTRLGLYNVTAASMLCIGPTGRTNTGSSHIIETRVEGEFTFAVQTTLEVRMYTASGNTYGMGYPESPIAGIGEVYSEFWAWKM